MSGKKNDAPQVDRREAAQVETEIDAYKLPLIKLLKALVGIRLPSRPTKVLHIIIIQSFDSATDRAAPTFISLKTFSTFTHLSTSHVCDAIKLLLELNLITRTYPGAAKLPYYAVVTDPSLWLISPVDETPSTADTDCG